jgi:hypothetical protein
LTEENKKRTSRMDKQDCLAHYPVRCGSHSLPGLRP